MKFKGEVGLYRNCGRKHMAKRRRPEVFFFPEIMNGCFGIQSVNCSAYRETSTVALEELSHRRRNSSGSSCTFSIASWSRPLRNRPLYSRNIGRKSFSQSLTTWKGRTGGTCSGCSGFLVGSRWTYNKTRCDQLTRRAVHYLVVRI